MKTIRYGIKGPLRKILGLLERNDFSSSRHRALSYCWRMIFSENRYPLFGIMREGIGCGHAVRWQALTKINAGARRAREPSRQPIRTLLKRGAMEITIHGLRRVFLGRPAPVAGRA